MKIIRTIIPVIILFPVIAQGAYLKSLVVLDFVNIENNPENRYLISSITFAVKKELKKRFVFKELPTETLKKVSETNFIYKDEYHTKTASINIGLLARQDIVISGKFYIKQGATVAVIVTTVHIFDIKKRSIISSFTIEGPADNRIWDTIKIIAKRISDKAKSILPNKAEWKRLGLKETKPLAPIFINPVIGIRGGVYYYSGAYENVYKAKQPLVGATIQWNVPIIWKRLALEIGSYYTTHSFKKGDDSILQRAGAEVTVVNYFFNGSFLIDIPVYWRFGVHPRIGSGMLFRFTHVESENNNDFIERLLFVNGGFDWSFKINKIVFLVVAPQVFMIFENGSNYTYINSVLAGIKFKL